MADQKISQLSSATALAGTEVVPVVQSSTTKKATINQILSPAAGNGVDFSANTPAAGKTSQLLNWYEEGTWTPGQGAGLTVVGTFSSSGTYTRVGNLVYLNGIISGSTSVAIGNGVEFTNNLPFPPLNNAVGNVGDAGYITLTGIRTLSPSLYHIGTQAATASMAFSICYRV